LERLQKFLANAGVASRRACEKLIVSGAVTVNGKVVNTLGSKVTEQDVICVAGKKIKTLEKKIYYVFNKPKNVIVTMQDTRGRETIADYFKDQEPGLHPVGRLDRETMGLLIVTNDGELTNLLTHPRFHIPKKYFVRVKGELSDEKLNNLQNGVKLLNGITSPAQVEQVRITGKTTEFYITIAEGKNRQIREMLLAMGVEVLSLMRVKIGSVSLRGLKLGQKRLLTNKELQELHLLIEEAGNK
jgi:23S rRNA pseudouridine2605 synthase